MLFPQLGFVAHYTDQLVQWSLIKVNVEINTFPLYAFLHLTLMVPCVAFVLFNMPMIAITRDHQDVGSHLTLHTLMSTGNWEIK